MDYKNYIHIPKSTLLTNTLNLDTKNSSKQSLFSTPVNSATSSLDHTTSNKTYLENRIITHPTVNKLLSGTVKQEEFDNNSLIITHSQLPSPTVINTVHLSSRETLNDLSIISMANTSNHLMSTLNPAHLPDGAESYFVSASNFKINPSSNTDIPSPSSSSNSSNPPSSSHHHHHHHQHHQTRRHGEGGDPTRKREMRLQKNREAARECRRKKKEYIKCLEERVAGLETQNKALIEELRQLKELYCQREDTNKKK